MIKEIPIKEIEEICFSNFEKLGFQLTQTEKQIFWIKHYEDGFESITYVNIRIRNFHKQIRTNFIIRKHFNEVEDLLTPYSDQLKLQAFHPLANFTFSILLSTLLKEKVGLVENKSHLLQFPITENYALDFQANSLQLIKENLLPFGSSLNNLKQLDALINATDKTEPKIRNMFSPADLTIIFKRLIIAKLAGSNNYERLVQYYNLTMKQLEKDVKGSSSLEKYANYPSVYQKIVEELKSISPLKNKLLLQKQTTL